MRNKRARHTHTRAAKVWPLALWLALSAGLPAWAERDAPLSAIDWLSQSIDTAPVATPSPQPPFEREPPVAMGGALPSTVAITRLDGPQPDKIGLIAPEVSNLPLDLWGAGRKDEIQRAILADRMESLPALRQLFLTILLAQSQGPADGGGSGQLLLARIDKLLLQGALQQAGALIQISGTNTPDLFRRAFDIAILTGHENRACARMQTAPGLAPSLPIRVFCLARAGNWDAAALTLSTASTLGDVGADQTEILSRFLDPDLFEGEPVPPPPEPVTPMDWQLYEAIGETIPTSTLPIAFAYAELGPNAGWKAQVEAAERLTRAGTIPPSTLHDLYTQRAPAASGGVWERVRAFQAIERAIALKDPARISAALPNAWARMQETELEVPFAFLIAPQLVQPALFERLTPEAQWIALRLGLLAPGSKEIASWRAGEVAAGHAQPLSDSEAFLLALAQGEIGTARAPNSMGRAIATAYTTPALSDDGTALSQGNRPGEALLHAIAEIQTGVEGDLPKITQGLSLLRAMGQDKVARQTALELLILERRG